MDGIMITAISTCISRKLAKKRQDIRLKWRHRAYLRNLPERKEMNDKWQELYDGYMNNINSGEVVHETTVPFKVKDMEDRIIEMWSDLQRYTGRKTNE